MKRIGVYCGSFNPFTIGHLNVYEKACNMFDEVIIAIGVNADKQEDKPYERHLELSKQLPDAKVDIYQGLTTDYMDRVKDRQGEECAVTLIRGLRDSKDLDYESGTIRYLQDLKPDISVALILCDRDYTHVSSSGVRAMQKFDKEQAKKYLLP